MNIYQQQILDEYHNPKNSGKPTQFTHSLKLENLSCGDTVEIFLNVQDNIIEDVHYVAEGCAISIASASLLSEELKGKTLTEIQQLDVDDVLKLLGIELTTSRLKCAFLPLEAIQKAVAQAPTFP